MMATESNDTTQIMNAMKSIIGSCTFNKVKTNDLTTYDAEYIFLQLRSKSVGENVEFELKCEECGTPNRVSLYLGDVGVFVPPAVSNKIQLNNEVGITLKPITLQESVAISKDTDVEELLIAVIDTIYDKENVYNSKDSTKNELLEFVGSLNNTQVVQIQKYVESIPFLEHNIAFGCSNCGHKNEVNLKGLQDFFA